MDCSALAGRNFAQPTVFMPPVAGCDCAVLDGSHQLVAPARHKPQLCYRKYPLLCSDCHHEIKTGHYLLEATHLSLSSQSNFAQLVTHSNAVLGLLCLLPWFSSTMHPCTVELQFCKSSKFNSSLGTSRGSWNLKSHAKLCSFKSYCDRAMGKRDMQHLYREGNVTSTQIVTERLSVNPRV